MTAPAPVNLTALEHAIAVVLVQHGLGDHETVQVDARPIAHGGYDAGVTVNVLAYTRPEQLPPAPRAAVESAEAADDLEAVS